MKTIHTTLITNSELELLRNRAGMFGRLTNFLAEIAVDIEAAESYKHDKQIIKKIQTTLREISEASCVNQ